MGDPQQYYIKGNNIAIRKIDADNIIVEKQEILGGNMLKIAFAGNPNVGKTALINEIAGSKLKVEAWPGVTVEKSSIYL